MSWRDEAACRGMDPELFFPTAQVGEVLIAQVAAAKAVCGRCPVRAECLAEALERLPYGVAGGLSEDERRALRRTRPTATRSAAGRSTRARSAREVAREHGVSPRTAQRWAAQARQQQELQAQTELVEQPAVAS